METETRVGLNLVEYEELARSILPAMSFDYIVGGSGDEAALTGNRKAFERWAIIPRVLTGAPDVDIATSVLGQPISMPVMVSPVAYHRLAHEDGEVATAAAAHKAGTIFTLSTLSTRTIEEIGQVTPDWWFQLYCFSDRSITLDLIRRAEAAGAKAIVVTVDTPVLGRREADERNRFNLPDGINMVNVVASIKATLPSDFKGSALAAFAGAAFHSSLTWDDMEWIASQTKLPVGVKGVLAAEDGRMAVQHGMKIVVVSNHGGRQLDHSIATLDALPDVAEAVENKALVLLDGGVRRGTDVMKALALGAKAVMIGRPVIWGLAHHGQHGVETILELLKAELKLDMLLAGCSNLEGIRRNLIRRIV